MANLIKSALIKQLSKYLKNVSANQINISTFKGEGEMKNIQLDENVLMDLLELPTWLSITNARCNKASLKIQWTKLKTIPIIIALDKIEVDMEINENLREYTTTKDSKLFDKDSTGPYGFIDRCIDGIQLNIDSITITIKSKKFNANLSMSNLLVYSTTPNWRVTSDIRNTRLKDLEKEEIIVFKEISWEICRLEAYNIEQTTQTQQQQPPTSIKLIMNPSKVQIAIKKKLSDKTLLNSTFRILLNEIYWMANDTQLKAAIGTYNTISKLLKKAALQKRKHMAYQQQQQQHTKSQDQSKISNSPQQPSQQTNIESSKVFLQYDIKETSLHLNISVLNIHLYADDNYSGNKLIDGGAMQVLFKDLCIDHYPYHKTGQSIKHWNNYNHIFRQREDWSKQQIEEFVLKLETILNKSNLNDINRIKLKNEINLLESCVIITLKDLCVYKVSTNMSNKSATFKSKKFANKSDAKPEDPLVNPNDLFKSNEYFIHQQMFNKRPFFSTNFAEFNLPSDTSFAHFFFSEFYFPDDCNYPVPCSQIFSHISPILINIDYLTLLWVNTLILSLWNEKLSVDKKKKSEILINQETNNDTNNDKQTRLNLHCDTHLELLMPKLTISIYAPGLKENLDHLNDAKRQCGIEVGFARISVTNKTGLSNDGNLKSACEKVYESSKNLCNKQSKFSVFTQESTNEDKLKQMKLNHLAPCFNDLIKNDNLSYYRYDLSFNDDLTKLINTTNEAQNSKLGLFLKSLNRSALNKNASKDIWCINFENMWLDSFSSNSSENLISNNLISQVQPNNNENIPLIQNISFKLWLMNVHDFYKSYEGNSSECCQQLVNGKNENVNNALNRLSKVIKIDNTEIEPERRRSNSLSTASVLVKNQQNSYYLCQKIYSKINIIGEINELSFRCDHSQIIFLLRLIDTFDMFTNQLKLDSDHTLKHTSLIDIGDAKDRNNNSNREAKINLNSEDLNEIDENFSAILNLSLIINSVDVELYLNDHRKEINADFKKERTISKSSPTETNMSIPLKPTDQLFDLNESLSDPLSHFDSSGLNITIKDPMKEELFKKDDIGNDFIDVSRKLDQEFISGYLKYIYGFSPDNPNMRLSFSSVHSLLDEIPNSNNNDILNLARQLQVNKLPTNINNVVSVGFTAASSTLIAKKNSTISFFNKPAFNQIKSNIKNQLNPQGGNDFNENDMLVDDNDSYSSIMGLEQDDTSSLASFATDLSTSFNQSNSPKEKTSPNEKAYDFVKQSSMSLSSSASSIAGINSKITSISSQVMTNETNHLENDELLQLSQADETNVQSGKSYNDYQCQTVQTNVPVKFKLKNIQTFVQVNENSDIFALVKLDQVKLRNIPSKYKKKSQSDKNVSLIDNSLFFTEELSEILIGFKKIEDSLDCKKGLVEVIIEDFFFELDMPTLTGLIDLIDDDDIGIQLKSEVMPANINVKNCQFNLNNQINDTEVYFKDEKTVTITINNLLVNRLANNEILISEFNTDKTRLPLKKRLKSVGKEASLNCLDEIENDTSSSKSVQLASLVFLLRKSKEDNHQLQTRLELEQTKSSEFEKENQMIKIENEKLSNKIKEINDSNKNSTDEAFFEKNEPKINLIELERKQFESLLQTYQDENEQLRNKLKKSDDLVAILNIERDCLMKKLNEQLKLSKK